MIFTHHVDDFTADTHQILHAAYEDRRQVGRVSK